MISPWDNILGVFYIKLFPKGGQEVVTTDFEELKLAANNPYPFPIKVKTYQTPRSPLDKNNGRCKILHTGAYLKKDSCTASQT